MLKQDGDDVLAFDPDTLCVHQFNSSLGRLAQLCDRSLSCEQLVAAFVESYGLDVNEASREVYRALRILNENELLENG